MNQETTAYVILANKVVLWAVRDAMSPIGTYGSSQLAAMEAKAFLLGGKDFEFYEPFLTEDVKKAASKARAALLRGERIHLREWGEVKKRREETSAAAKKCRAAWRKKYERTNAIIKANAARMSLAELAALTGLSKDVVAARLRKLGIKSRRVTEAERVAAIKAAWARKRLGGISGGKKKDCPGT